jgi:hypothetical protein
MKLKLFLLLCIIGISMTGCKSFGPGTIERDRMNYMTAVSDSMKTQMLLNLVKMRYGDMPVFMDVASVINQYSLQANAGFDNTFVDHPYHYTSSLGIGSQYADRPTITYSPMTGSKFTRSLMTPIPPSVVLNFLQSGKSPDFLLHFCVQSMNGVQNQGLTTPSDPRFEKLIRRICEMQRLGGVVVKFGHEKNNGITSLVITNPNDPKAKAGREEIREILQLRPDATEYTVEYGGSPANDTEIAMVTRSVFDIMFEVAMTVDVPQVDVDEGRAYPFPPLLHDPAYKTLARIHSGQSPSPDAAVIVRYRDLWFWIDDRDLESKKVLSTLLLMVNLAESGRQNAAPLVTIPAG